MSFSVATAGQCLSARSDGLLCAGQGRVEYNIENFPPGYVLKTVGPSPRRYHPRRQKGISTCGSLTGVPSSKSRVRVSADNAFEREGAGDTGRASGVQHAVHHMGEIGTGPGLSRLFHEGFRLYIHTLVHLYSSHERASRSPRSLLSPG